MPETAALGVFESIEKTAGPTFEMRGASETRIDRILAPLFQVPNSGIRGWALVVTDLTENWGKTDRTK